MSRDAILAEIRALERQKIAQPHLALSIDMQITALCDRLKQLDAAQYRPRSVI